jgi:hypothetical protein
MIVFNTQHIRMPEKCLFCPMANFCGYEDKKSKTRPKDCPLIDTKQLLTEYVAWVFGNKEKTQLVKEHTDE